MKKVFVVISALALTAALAAPALAFRPQMPQMPVMEQDIIVTNNKTADINNAVVVSVSTGANIANGGCAEEGGDGGDVEDNDNNQGDQNITAGNGGAGGDGGNGGMITTGDAGVMVTIDNTVNTDMTEIDACGCEEEEPAEDACGMDSCGQCGCGCGCQTPQQDCVGCPDDIIVTNNDDATVDNAVVGAVETGQNVSDGSKGEEGGDGGDVEDNDNGEEEDCQRGPRGCYGGCNNGCCGDQCDEDANTQNNTAGDGGVGGDGGNGGEITTGEAVASVSIVNMINTIITRIFR